jgi:hypothetical protein
MSPRESGCCDLSWTLASSIVVNHLQAFFDGANVAVACIYCNYKEQATQTVSNLVAGLLKQMVQNNPVTSDNIKSFYKHHRARDTRPTLEEFLNALGSEIGLYSKVFIIVDALDECAEDSGTRAGLLKALRALAGTVNLMVTSRDLSSIARTFEGTKQLNIYAHDQDIRRYVEDRINSVPRQHLIALQQTIEDKIIQNARGM